MLLFIKRSYAKNMISKIYTLLIILIIGLLLTCGCTSSNSSSATTTSQTQSLYTKNLGSVALNLDDSIVGMVTTWNQY